MPIQLTESVRHLPRSVLRIVRKFTSDRCLTHAGNLAYISILSLVPMIVVGVSLFSVYGISPEMKKSILDVFLKHMLPSTAESAYAYIDRFVSNAKVLGLPGMVILIFLSYSLYSAVQDAFQTIWHVTKRRSLIQNILVFTNVLFWTPLLMGISIYLKTKLEFAYHANVLSEYILSTLAFLLPWAGYTAAYLIIPPIQTRFKSAALGGLLASVLWFILLHGFDIYVKYTQSMQTLSKLYGSLVIIPVFLVWVYFCWVVTFVGAEVASYHQFSDAWAGKDKDGNFWDALSILLAVARAFQEGKGGLGEGRILRQWPNARETLEDLTRLRILEQAGETYFLKRPPEKIDVAEMFQAIARPGEIGGAYNIIGEGLKGKTLRDLLA